LVGTDRYYIYTYSRTHNTHLLGVVGSSWLRRWLTHAHECQTHGCLPRPPPLLLLHQVCRFATWQYVWQVGARHYYVIYMCVFFKRRPTDRRITDHSRGRDTYKSRAPASSVAQGLAHR
jgi:hypothetical protein